MGGVCLACGRYKREGRIHENDGYGGGGKGVVNQELSLSLDGKITGA